MCIKNIKIISCLNLMQDNSNISTILCHQTCRFKRKCTRKIERHAVTSYN